MQYKDGLVDGLLWKKGWRPVGPGGGGAQFYPGISPHDDQQQLCFCDMQGTYMSRDGGKNWRNMSLRGGGKSVAFDPVKPNVVYVGSTGLYRSEDYGCTWEVILPKSDDIIGEYWSHDEAMHTFTTKSPWVSGSIQGIAAGKNGELAIAPKELIQMPDKPRAGSKFWNFIMDAAQPDEAELFLWGPISETSWWGDEVTPKQFAGDLIALGGVKKITVRINSPGGDVFAAIAISALLRDHPAEIVVQIDGLCASAATIISSDADRTLVSASSMLMIHDPWSIAQGTAEDMAKMAEVLNKCKDAIIESYTKKTGLSYEELSAMMKAETWMSGREAVELGFADELIGEEPAGATGSLAYHPVTVFASLCARVLPKPARPEATEQSGQDVVLEIETLRAELELLSH